MQAATDLLLRTQQQFKKALAQDPAWQRIFDDRRALVGELPAVWLASDHVIGLTLTRTDLLIDLLQQGDIQHAYTDWPQHLADFKQRCLPGLVTSDSMAALQVLLRRFRQREWLRIVWRDVNGRASLQQTCADLTALAETCISYALPRLQTQLEAQYGQPLDTKGESQQLIVLAMGKFGARELNLSSDIDLIFAFPEDGETRCSSQWQQQYPQAQSCTIQNFFTRLGQQLLEALDTVTADGFVFRVDMRLRPYGSAGALALSYAALEEYYHSQGRDWERFAMIKVRAVTGQSTAVGPLMQMLQGFTYRRFLDFATIESLRDLKRQIEQQVRRKSMQRNIKLGSGGIREIEFIVQVSQLVHGGRRPALQVRPLHEALQALVEAGLVAQSDADTLLTSYQFLRRLEHAIQALRDQQTHDYPEDELAEHRIAISLEILDVEVLRTRLAEVRAIVGQHFQDVIRTREQDPGDAVDISMQQVWLGNLEPERALAVLSEKGFGDAGELLRSVDNFKRSRQVLGLDRRSRDRLDNFMPLLLTLVAKAGAPSLAFLRVFTFVQAVVQRSAYLVLLMENPLALRQLLTLCAASPWVVELLSRYPVLLDELLRPLKQPPLLPELRSLLQQQLLRSGSHDIEGQLNVIQYFKQEQVLNVAAAELLGEMPLMQVSDYLTWIAETVVEQVLQLAWQLLTSRHGCPLNNAGHSGDCDFIIIAYGKLGGLELSYGSDLDLVFVHDGHPEADTSGGINGPINSTAFYVQLAQKILALLSTQTLVGKLYEIDLRLRPSGASGALVSSLAAFERYQQRQAWTWEHQAQVRARVIAGAPALAASFAKVRDVTLSNQRDLKGLQHDILEMRDRMVRQHGSKHVSRFDLKQDSGGLIDIEFMVQYLVLAYAAHHQQLLRYSDNMRLLDMAASLGLLSHNTAASLQGIYLEYRTELHKRALNLQNSVLDGDACARERNLVREAWQHLFETRQDSSSEAEQP